MKASSAVAQQTQNSETPAGDLSLNQIMRIMDVASTLRREREVVEQQFAVEHLRSELREKMLRAAEVSGEHVLPEEIDAAIEQYFENLHRFDEPPASWETWFAKLYVRRKQLALWALPVLVAVAGMATTAYWLWW